MKSGERGRRVESEDRDNDQLPVWKETSVFLPALQSEALSGGCEASEAVAIQSQSFANDVTRKSWMPGRSPA